MTTVPTKSLAEIATSVRYGYTASASDEPIGPHFLRITDIVPPQIDWGTVPYCEIDDLRKGRFSLASGDIVIARTGATVGYAKLIRRRALDAVFASYLVRIRIDPDKADPGYVGRIVESQVYKRFVVSRVGGAAQPNANAKVLSEFRLPIPSHATQGRIASILSAYDDLIDNNRRRIQLLERTARLLYREWFVHLRFPGHERKTITDGVPEGWARRIALDLMDVLSGGTPRTTVRGYWDGEIPFFTPKDATDCVYTRKTQKTLTEEGLRHCNSILFPKNTIFITARGTVGKTYLARTEMAMNQSCYGLIARTPLDQCFMYFALGEAVDEFRSRAVGSVFDAIVRDTFSLIKILVPPEATVDRFSTAVQPMLYQIDVLLQEVDHLTQSRDLLLPRLMNGEIPV